MGGPYKRKGNREVIDEKCMTAAIFDVVKRRKSIRSAAAIHGVKKSTLSTRVKNYKEKNNLVATNNASDDSGQSDDDSIQMEDQRLGLNNIQRKKFYHRQIFTDNEELLLKEYLLTSSNINFGLTYCQTRKLAYEYAVLLKRPCPKSWIENSKAGIDWMKLYIHRHPDLSIRKPENTSLARALSFNKTNVSEFFTNYKNLMIRYKFQPSRIFNLDETGITTVVPAPSVSLIIFTLQKININVISNLILF